MLGNDTINILARRIFEQIPIHPEILDMTNVWELLDIREIKFDDLSISIAQARHALIRAVECYEAGLNVEQI